MTAKNPSETCISKWRKIDPRTVPVSAKACANYLNAYLARKDAVTRGFDIGIMLGTDGLVTEGSVESVFIVVDNVLKTPPFGQRSAWHIADVGPGNGRVHEPCDCCGTTEPG